MDPDRDDADFRRLPKIVTPERVILELLVSVSSKTEVALFFPWKYRLVFLQELKRQLC